MATTTIDSNLSGYQYGYLLSVDGDGLIVAPGARVEGTSQFGSGIYAQYSNQTITVEGTVVGGRAIIMGGHEATSANNTLVVGASGLVQGVDFGAWLFGSGTMVTNQGRIEGTYTGLCIMASGDSTVENWGIISGGAQGLAVFDDSYSEGSRTTFLNYGSLLHSNVLPDGVAYRGSDQVDRFGNYGTVQGDIELGGGDDLFDGLGAVTMGAVYGGDGNDYFWPGEGTDVFHGGAGNDALDFRNAEGLWLSLVDGTGTGAARGDTYVGFETVFGSDRGNDTLIGNDVANTLVGMGGDDRLIGGKGRDILAGELGWDRLTGGSGRDAFIFAAPDAGFDRITDFGSTRGNNDLIAIMADGFGLDLPFGLLDPSAFRSGTSNRARDVDDRFIFRTTDKTLWFDEDGRGGDGPVMIADLQYNARLTAADILIV